MANSSQIHSDNKNIYTNNIIIRLIIIITGIGVLLTAWFLWITTNFYSVASTKIDLEATSWVGTWIGGVLGPILSFSGMLLLYVTIRYQREDLRLQAEQIKITRNEFHINQLTGILYHHIEKIQRHIENFKIVIKKTDFLTLEYEANDALSEISSTVTQNWFNNLPLLDKIVYLQNNEDTILTLLRQVSGEFKSYKKILAMYDTTSQDSKKLKDLFIFNLGVDFIILLEYLVTLSTEAELEGPNVDVKFLVNSSEELKSLLSPFPGYSELQYYK